MERRWWKEAVVYQIWPRSFRDSDGDGIGDLRGVTETLDHVAALGVDVIWLSPFYDSPNVDNGYDVRDYRAVGREFGTMADFDALLAAAKARGLRVIVDLVVNHSSDEHAWFVESRRSRESPFRDYYIWRPGQDGRPPNDWRSFFSGSAWTRDDATGDFYLHLFHEKQPDLNWEHEPLRREVHDLMRFWLDKGVDGFRMDVIAFISKEPGFPDYPPEHSARTEFFHAFGPRLLDHLHEMKRQVLDDYDAVTVGEAFGVTFEQAARLTDEAHGPLDMLIHFDAVRLDRGEGWRWRPWTLPELKAVFSRQDREMGPHSWRSVCLSNHDNPRLVSHFGDDAPEWRARSAACLATLLLTLRGTPFVYQGDEIGMTDFPFERIDQFDDIEVRNHWRDEVETGRVSAAAFLADLRKTSRDHARTPMQWSAGPNAGFTAGDPWFAVNPNFAEINVEADRGAPDSIQAAYARLIALRKATPPLAYGDYVDRDPEHPRLYVFTRRLGDDACLIVLNFGRETLTYDPPPGWEAARLVHRNLPGEPKAPHAPLAGWEARIYRIGGEEEATG